MLRAYKTLFIVLLISFSCSKKDIEFLQEKSAPNIEFVKTFGGSNNETLQAITNTIDGGYITVGHTQSSDNDITDKTNSSYNFWVLKFSSSDELIWSKTFGGSDDDRARDIVELVDGSFIITGFSRSSDGDISKNAGNYDFWTIKIDANGIILWEKSFGFSGSDQSYIIKKTNDGGFLLGGSLDVTASGGAGNFKSNQRHAGGDYWLIKIDAEGTKKWSRYYGGLFTDTLLDLTETDNGDYILVGSSDSDDTDISNNIGSYDFWVVKINNSGDLIWEKNYGGSQIDEAFSILKTVDNHYIIVGNSRSNDINIAENNGSADIWIIKIDVDGNLIWEKNYGGSSFENSTKIITSTNGGFLITGSSRSEDLDVSNNKGNKDVWVIKINDLGNLEWQKNIGGSELDEANSILELQNGALILVGESWSTDSDIIENKGFSDGLIIKLK